MSQGYAFSERFIERRLAQGWAAVERALGLLEALTGAGASSPSHISRTLHRRACALLRPAEKMARRIITTLAAKLPAPKLPPAKPLPPAPDRNGPRMSRIEICGPLHAVLHPRPPKARQPNRSTAPSFRLIEPFGGPSLNAYNPPRRPFAKSAPAISDFNRDAPRPDRDSALLQINRTCVHFSKYPHASQLCRTLWIILNAMRNAWRAGWPGAMLVESGDARRFTGACRVRSLSRDHAATRHMKLWTARYTISRCARLIVPKRFITSSI